MTWFMATMKVKFEFITGLKRRIFRNARLRGSWDGHGRYSDDWTESPMSEEVGEDGCPIFRASVSFEPADEDRTFKWGVVLDGPQGSDFWGIPTEIQDVHSVARHRQFRLQDAGAACQVERYHFTCLRRLGANKRFTAGSPTPGLVFAVWAPNAKGVEVVFGDPKTGYLADDGSGIDVGRPVVALSRRADGVWEGGPPGEYAGFKSAPYMYRILNAQGATVYRTDVFSRSQIGRGATDPAGAAWPGPVDTLDGTVSCSVVIDPEVVRCGFDSTPAGGEPDLIPAEEFWAGEFTCGLPVPTRIEDLVIYELHVGSLGFGKAGPGDLGDARTFLDHLVGVEPHAAHDPAHGHVDR